MLGHDVERLGSAEVTERHRLEACGLLAYSGIVVTETCLYPAALHCLALALGAQSVQGLPVTVSPPHTH